MFDAKELALQLRKLREKTGIKTTDIARECGIAASSVSHIENMRHCPSHRILRALEKFFELPEYSMALGGADRNLLELYDLRRRPQQTQQRTEPRAPIYRAPFVRENRLPESAMSILRRKLGISIEELAAAFGIKELQAQTIEEMFSPSSKIGLGYDMYKFLERTQRISEVRAVKGRRCTEQSLTLF